jgi:hemolysin activation/secretion protein
MIAMFLSKPASAQESSPMPESSAEQSRKSTPIESKAKVHVRSFAFTGNTVVTDVELSQLAGSYVDKDVGLDELQEVADRVTNLYRQKGYTLARAYLVAQQPTEGIIRIAILEGRLSEIVITGNHYYSRQFIQRGFAPVINDRVIRHRSLERSLLTLNDNMDLKVSATLAPGATAGTTKILANVEERMPLHVALDINNFGFVNISRYRFGGTVDVGNVLFQGSVLTLNGIVGDKPDQLSYQSITYSVPVNGWGTRLILSASNSKFAVGGALATLNISAKVKSYDVSVTHPLIKSTFQNLTGEIGFASKDNPLFAQGQLTFNDALRMLKAGVNYDRTDNTGRTFASLYGYQGLGEMLGGMDNNSALASHVGTDNRFQKADLSLGRIHSLGHDFFLLVRGTGQISTGPLPIIEQVLLGGPDTVRGYQLGERFVDEAYTVSGEVRIPTPYKPVQLLTFIDHGMGRNRTPQAGQPRGESLTAAGIGTRLSFPKWYDAALRADLGFPIDPSKAQGGSLAGGSSPTLYFQATMRY